MGWAGFELPDLAPIVGTEATASGWRGITGDGEILEVTSSNGVPDAITVFAKGEPIGRRAIENNAVDIGAYLDVFNRAIELHKADENVEALAAIDATIAIAPTARARFNRAMILLALGRWREGFVEYEVCEREPPFQRPNAQALAAGGIPPWRGEPLAGKRLLIAHDHGFGDTLMMLRFVAAVRDRGAQIALMVPPELTQIAQNFGDVWPWFDACDYCSSFLHLLRWLEVEPQNVPTGPYIDISPQLVKCWRDELGTSDRQRIGIAWSVGVHHDGDFPREVPLAEIVRRYPDAELHSIQTQGAEEAASLGVAAHELADFASAAALMSMMDEIVSVDTAAIHIAGAIGHANATVLLSRWHSWRWRGNPFYPDVRIVASGR